MIKKLIIAEKHKMAQAIMEGLKEKFQKFDSYYESDKHIVTFTQGHLLALFDIDDYVGVKAPWNISVLPFFPTDFQYKPIKTVDKFKEKQVVLIKNLINRTDVDSIIHCGDPDREGELLVRLVLEKVGNKKPVYRMWCSSILPSAAIEAYNNMTPDSNYDTWANEGKARQFMDWLFGINYTRYITLKLNSGLMRVGRVLVPIVKFVYDRDKAIANFVPKNSWHVEGVISFDSNERVLRNKDLIFEQSEKNIAEQICESLKKQSLIVSNVSKRTYTKKPLKLFSGINLQMYLSKKYGITVENSLNAMQSLYEDGYISYPRTNTEYLTLAEKNNVSIIIKNFSAEFPLLKLQMHTQKNVFDDTKCEGHTAIIPTVKIPSASALSSFSETEKKVYESVKDRFLANFWAVPSEIRKAEAEFVIDKYTYILSGETVLEKGFMEIEPLKIEAPLPLLTKGQIIPVTWKVEERESKPPKRTTTSELLAYLKNPFKDVLKTVDKENDEEYYKMLSEGCNLGTEATVTNIINNAIKTEYIEQVGKENLVVLPKGELLIESLLALGINLFREENIEFNKKLRLVFKDTLSLDDCIDAVKKDIHDTISKSFNTTISGSIAPVKDSIGKCPKCGCDVVERPNAFSCVNKGACDFFIYKEDSFFRSKGKQITKQLAIQILKGKSFKLTKCKKKNSSDTYDCLVTPDFSGKYIKWNMNFEKKGGEKP